MLLGLFALGVLVSLSLSLSGEQVGAILFLASDEASYITGVTLPVGGGDLG